MAVCIVVRDCISCKQSLYLLRLMLFEADFRPGIRDSKASGGDGDDCFVRIDSKLNQRLASSMSTPIMLMNLDAIRVHRQVKNRASMRLEVCSNLISHRYLSD